MTSTFLHARRADNGDGRIRTYAFFRAPRVLDHPLRPRCSEAMLRERFAGWAGWMVNLINYCDEGAIYPRALWPGSLPVWHKWTQVPRVTLVGDAAYFMSRFAGRLEPGQTMFCSAGSSSAWRSRAWRRRGSSVRSAL